MCVLNFSRNSRPPVQKELELDFRAGISSCRAEEVHGVMVALHAAPADVRHQLAAARAKAAQAVAAHRSCQTDFLRLERMFNEVVPNSPSMTLELFCAAVCSRHTCPRSCRKTTSCVRARCSDSDAAAHWHQSAVVPVGNYGLCAARESGASMETNHLKSKVKRAFGAHMEEITGFSLFAGGGGSHFLWNCGTVDVAIPME